MILRLDREDPDPKRPELTWGDIYADNEYECCTLEDQVRERPGVAVPEWKVAKRTAIPSGIYRLELQHSPHFGPDTPTLLEVPGFDLIRIHGGTDVDDSEGCVLVGSRQDRIRGTLHGAKVAQAIGGTNGAARVVLEPVLAVLKARIRAALLRGTVHIQIRNGAGWYREHGITMPAPLP